MTVQISNPSGGNVNIQPNTDFTVCGTIDDPDPVDGMLIDEGTNDVYLPTGDTVRRDKDRASWSLTFNIADTIAQDEYLLMYAYDTATGDGAQVTYQEEPGGSTGCADAAAKQEAAATTAARGYSSSVTITVSPTPSLTEVQNISVTVTHPESTRGLLFLILWRKHAPEPVVTIVESHRLTAGGTTHHTFRRIEMNDWDLVTVNVAVKGGQPAKPVVLKPAPLKGK